MSSSALRLVLPPDDAAIGNPQHRRPQDPQAWLWLSEAAERAGITEGTLRNRCLSDWQHRGLARKAEREDGGRRVIAWQVSELADPRFARVKSPETLSEQADLSHLTDAQRDEVLRQERIVKGMDQAAAAGITLGLTRRAAIDRYVTQLQAAGERVSRATLYRWHRAWRTSGREGLIDQRWTRGQQEGASDAGAQLYRDTFLRLWLDQRRRSKRLCHELAAHQVEQAGYDAPSYSTAKRIAASVPPAVVTLKRKGRDKYKDDHAPFIERDYSSIDANDWWCSDHYRMDVMVKVGERINKKTGAVEPIYDRPWLHAWMDVRSRKIVGWAIVAHDPNADLILRTVSDAVQAHGAPRTVYIDNGDDFDARALQGVTKRQRRSGIKPGDLSPAELRRVGGAFGLLGVEVVHCWPYHGQAKPNEAWHRKIRDRFCKLFDTYTGGTTAERPDDLQKHLKAGHAPTLEELRTAFGDWVRDDHNGRAHLGDSMDGQTPDQVFDATLPAKRTLPAELIKFACMPRVGPVKVRQNGVHWSELSFNAAELDKLYGQRVMLAIDVEDLSGVIVLDLEGRVICRARANQKLPWGAGKQELRDAIVAKRRAIKAQKTYHEHRPRMTLDAPDMMRAMSADRAAAARKATPPIDPPPAAMVRTPFSDQLPALRAALEATPRKAVGGESIDPSTIHSAFSRSAGATDTGGGDAFQAFAGAFQRPRSEEQS